MLIAVPLVVLIYFFPGTRIWSVNKNILLKLFKEGKSAFSIMIGFTIREARREDCKEIRRLIQASLLCFLHKTLLSGPKYIIFD